MQSNTRATVVVVRSILLTSVCGNTAAIAAQAAGDDAVLRPLSSIQHKGFDGLTIGVYFPAQLSRIASLTLPRCAADPDRSNPTRSRWERPLETIRSFEAAIDGGYNRKSFHRSESESALNGWNRRTSHYGSMSSYDRTLP